jgi:hypothetical protein
MHSEYTAGMIRRALFCNGFPERRRFLWMEIPFSISAPSVSPVHVDI